MAAVLGIDLGTQGVTALAVDAASGRVLASASRPLGLSVGHGGVREQDPTWWWDATVDAVRSFDGIVDVHALAVAGQQHGLVCIDGTGEAIGPARLWNDTSSADWTKVLTDRIGGPAAVRALIGMDLQPGYTASHLAYLKDHDPDRFTRARRFCLPHDYLTGRFLGQAVTDAGDASGTGYFDPRSREWSEPMLATIDPSGSLPSRLPPIAPPGVALGELPDQLARELRLRPRLAVCNGTGNNAATAVAMGLSREGQLGISLGTSGTAFAYSAAPATDPLGEIASFCDATGGWLPLFCTLNCTQVLSVLADTLGTDLVALEAAATQVPPGAGGATFLPHLDGERSPALEEGSGAILGLRAASLGPAYLARAAYEGVVLALAYGLDGLGRAGVRPQSATLAGGGAASPLLRRLVADVFGVPVTVVPSAEPAAWGAAALAAWALTGEDVAAIVRRWWRGAGHTDGPAGTGAVVQPEPAAVAFYAAERRRRRELLDRVYPDVSHSPPEAAPHPPVRTGQLPPPPPRVVGDPDAAFRPA